MTTLRPATPQEAGRSVALNLVRLWDLVDLLNTTLPPAASASEMLSYHIHKMADRARRAQHREGRCAVQEGCGRENLDAVDHHPEPRLYPGLFNALMALADLWRAAPPASYSAAADQLSTVLRSQEQLHSWCARALCPTCRLALLARLAERTLGDLLTWDSGKPEAGRLLADAVDKDGRMVLRMGELVTVRRRVRDEEVDVCDIWGIGLAYAMASTPVEVLRLADIQREEAEVFKASTPVAQDLAAERRAADPTI